MSDKDLPRQSSSKGWLGIESPTATQSQSSADSSQKPSSSSSYSSQNLVDEDDTQKKVAQDLDHGTQAAPEKASETAKSTKRFGRIPPIREWPEWLIYYAGLVLAVSLYFSFLAKDRYVSRSKFVVTGDSNSQSSLMAMLGPTQNDHDAYTAISHIYSADMVKWLAENGFDIRQHYSKSGFDILNHLGRKAQLEDVIDYYRNRVDARLNAQEGIITVEVEAFTRDYAKALATAILARSEEYMNDLNRQIAQQRMDFVGEELEKSQNSLEEAAKAVLAYQNANATINPADDIKSELELIQTMKKESTFMKADLTKLKAESPFSPRIPELDNKVKALAVKIKDASDSLTGEQPGQLNQMLADFMKLDNAEKFARQRYQQSLSILEEIRIQTMQQHRFLAVLESPFVPEAAERPRRLYSIITFAFLGLLAISLLRLIVSTIREHQQTT